MGLVGFECPLRGEKKLLLENENLDSVLRSIPTWNTARLNSENVDIENEGTVGKIF